MELNWTDISEYRKREIEEAVELMGDILKGTHPPEYFKGVMTLFSRIMKLPASMCNKADKEVIDDMINKEFSSVELKLLRRSVQDND